MKQVIVYVLETIVCSGALYMFYRLLLDRRVSLGICRVYLVGSMLLAAVIPALRIPIYPADVVYYAVPEESVEEQVLLANALRMAQSTTLEAENAAAEVTPASPDLFAANTIDNRSEFLPLFLEWMYGTVTAFAFALLLLQLWKIYGYRRGAQIEYRTNYTLVRNWRIPSPFSFFRGIYVPDRYTPSELSRIITHESSHIRRYHSVDLMIMEILRAVMWFNPFVWMARRSLVEVHEFQADRDVLDAGVDLMEYRMLIFRQLFGCNPDVTNGLNGTQIKKRFMMMTRQTKHRFSLLKTVVALPVLGVLLMLFSFTRQETVYVDVTGNQYPGIVTDLTRASVDPIASGSTPIVVEGVVKDEQNRPVPNATIRVRGESGGVFTDYDGKYSIMSAKGGVLVFESEGKRPVEQEVTGERLDVMLVDAIHFDENSFASITSDTLVVKSTGSVDSTWPGNSIMISAWGKRKSQDSLSKGQVTGIQRSNDSEYQKLIKKVDLLPSGVSFGISIDPLKSVDNVLYIVDGVPQDNIDSLDPNQIVSIGVEKGTQAAKQYGAKAADGIVRITTKANKMFAELQSPALQKQWQQIVAKSPVCIVDGTKIMNASEINSDEVVSFTKVTDKDLIQSFGEKGKNGVYLVRTLKMYVIKSSEVATTTFYGPDYYRAKGIKVYGLGESGTDDRPPIYHADTYIVKDGKRISYDEFKKDKDGFNIVRVNYNLLSGEQAVKKYGNEAKSGALEINTIKSPIYMGLIMDYGRNRKWRSPKFEGKSVNDFRKWVIDKVGVVDCPENDPGENNVYIVQISFVVDSKGNVTDVCNINRPGTKPDEVIDRVLEVVRNSPRWEPGMLNGKPVDTKYLLIIHAKAGHN